MFSIDPSIIEDFYTNYEQVRTLTDITSETDPEEDPYKSLYQARDILEKNLLPSPIANTDILTKVSLNYQLAINYKLSNEIATARNILETKCLKTLEDYEKTELERGETFSSTVDSQTQTQIKQNPILCSTALIKVHILQDLAITQTADPEKSLNNLLKAKTIVDSLCQAKNSYFIDEKLIRKTTEVIAIDQRKKRIDSALLQTVFCLGQAYQNMNDSENSSKFIIKTLQLQYTQNQYNNKKWALDAAAISQYFITNGHFLQAAHCLQCSEYILSQTPKNSANLDISEQAEIELAEKKEAKQPEILSKKEISEAKSDIARCWVKLIVNFLEYAAIFQIRNNLLPTAKSLSISNDLDENKFNPNLNYELFQLPETVKKVPFDLNFFKHPIKCTYDNCIKDMFLFAMSGCFFAKKYFNIENGFVIDSIEIALDENMLWQYLACFEEDMVDQCKMLKRRYRCLEEFIITPTVKEVDEEELAGSNPDPVRKTPSHVRKFPNHKLNRKHYLDNVKQLWHTTSEIFADLMTLKRQIYTRFGEKSNNFQFIEPPVNWDLSGEAQLSRSIKNTFPPMNKREVLKKKMDLEFSINRAGMRAIKAALEFEKCFDSNLVNREPNIEFGDGDSQNKNNKENKKSSLLESAFEVATKKNLQPSLNFFNDSEKRAYLLTIMRKGRTFQTLIPNNDDNKRLFMKYSKEAFSQVRNFENYETLLRPEESRLCEEFEKLLPQAADLIR